jgi:hypothetical protein
MAQLDGVIQIQHCSRSNRAALASIQDRYHLCGVWWAKRQSGAQAVVSSVR